MGDYNVVVLQEYQQARKAKVGTVTTTATIPADDKWNVEIPGIPGSNAARKIARLLSSHACCKARVEKAMLASQANPDKKIPLYMLEGYRRDITRMKAIEAVMVALHENAPNAMEMLRKIDTF